MRGVSLPALEEASPGQTGDLQQPFIRPTALKNIEADPSKQSPPNARACEKS